MPVTRIPNRPGPTFGSCPPLAPELLPRAHSSGAARSFGSCPPPPCGLPPEWRFSAPSPRFCMPYSHPRSVRRTSRPNTRPIWPRCGAVGMIRARVSTTRAPAVPRTPQECPVCVPWRPGMSKWQEIGPRDRGCARGYPCPAISPDVSPAGAAPKGRVTRNTTDPDSPDMPSTPQPIAAKSYNASGAIHWAGLQAAGSPGC